VKCGQCDHVKIYSDHVHCGHPNIQEDSLRKEIDFMEWSGESTPTFCPYKESAQ